MNSTSSTESHKFPIARTVRRSRRWLAGVSRMWWITLVCLFLAIGLTIHSLEPSGQPIVIEFPDGHGLKAGDSLRHRGIEIGHVTKVQLSDNLAGVHVHIELDPAAAAVAREGSRFWIVRPQIDLTGVSGLETAVGSKYVAVIPGQAAAPAADSFQGLASRPPNSLGDAGIEIVLRGDDRNGLTAGTPVTWRGVEVGQVIDSQLSPDALHVDTRLYIRQPHRRLLARDSKFWVTSGVHMAIGVTGMQLDTGTLDTITRGGVAMITPGQSAHNGEVRAGDMFTLHEEFQPRWLTDATALNLLTRDPPATVSVTATWKQKQFGITRERQLAASGFVVPGVGGPFVLVPRDIAEPPTSAVEGSHEVILLGENGDEFKLQPSTLADDQAQPYVRLVFDLVKPYSGAQVPPERCGSGETPEDCLLVRHSRHDQGELATMIESIGQHELTDHGDSWTVSTNRLSHRLWHGAIVISAADERIIGMFIVGEDHAAVAPLRLSP